MSCEASMPPYCSKETPVINAVIPDQNSHLKLGNGVHLLLFAAHITESALKATPCT
jgi:hypothetical protein